MQDRQHFFCPGTVKIGVKILEEVQNFADALLPVQIGLIRQVGDDRLGFRADFLAADSDLPGAWGQKPRRDFQKGGLAAAVGAEQAHDLSLGQLQLQAVQRPGAAVVLHKAGGL